MDEFNKRLTNIRQMAEELHQARQTLWLGITSLPTSIDYENWIEVGETQFPGTELNNPFSYLKNRYKQSSTSASYTLMSTEEVQIALLKETVKSLQKRLDGLESIK